MFSATLLISIEDLKLKIPIFSFTYVTKALDSVFIAQQCVNKCTCTMSELKPWCLVLYLERFFGLSALCQLNDFWCFELQSVI